MSKKLKALAEETTEIHKRLIQLFMEKKVMQDTDVHDFLRDFSGDEVVVNSDYIDKNISEVNKRVEYLGFNIKRRKYRLGGKTRIDFCIINAEEDTIAKGSMTRTCHEKLMEVIKADETSIAFRKSEDVDRLLEAGWLEKIEDEQKKSKIYLGSRAILEYQEYLRDVDGFDVCSKCKQLVVLAYDDKFMTVASGEGVCGLCRQAMKRKSSK